MTSTQQKAQMLTVARGLSDAIASAVIAASKKTPLGKTTKSRGKGGDISKYGDLLAEKIAINYLNNVARKKIFDRIVLATEESGIHEFKNTSTPRDERSIFIIMDPVDGSNNMRAWITPQSFVGTSIAVGTFDRLRQHGDIAAVEVAVIRDIFYHLQFFAVKNQGAFLVSPELPKPTRLHVGKAQKVSDAILAISLDRNAGAFRKTYAKLRVLLENKKCQRHLGSTVLNMSRVAGGEFDGSVSASGAVKIHDIAAAQLIIAEAGGYVHLFRARGKQYKKYLRELILLGNEKVIREVGFFVVTAANKKLLNNILRSIL